jgi:hypothetical protein
MNITQEELLFFAAVIGLYVLGSIFGRIGKATAWRVSMGTGAACLGIAEPMMFMLYQNGSLTLDKAFMIGAGFACVGAFAFGFGVQKIIKAQAFENKASHSTDKT